MKEIMNWLLELEDNSEIIAIATVSKTNIPGFRIQKAPRKKVINALIQGNILKIAKELLNVRYKNEGKDYEELSIEELKKKAIDQSEDIPILLLSLLDNNHNDIAKQLFEELKEEGILNICEKERKGIQEGAKQKTETDDDYAKLYREAMKKVQLLESKLQKAKENVEKLRFKDNIENEELKITIESLEQKIQEEGGRSEEALENLSRERETKEFIEIELEDLKCKLTKLEKENKEYFEIIRGLEEKLELRIEEKFVSTAIGGVIVGNASLQKLVSSSPYMFVLESNLTDSILCESPQVILPVFANTLVTQRKVAKYAADRTIEIKTFQELKDYLERSLHIKGSLSIEGATVV